MGGRSWFTPISATLLVPAMSPEIPTRRAPKLVDHTLLGKLEVSNVAVAVKYGEPWAELSVGMATESMAVEVAPFL